MTANITDTGKALQPGGENISRQSKLLGDRVPFLQNKASRLLKTTSVIKTLFFQKSGYALSCIHSYTHNGCTDSYFDFLNLREHQQPQFPIETIHIKGICKAGTSLV